MYFDLQYFIAKAKELLNWSNINLQLQNYVEAIGIFDIR